MRCSPPSASRAVRMTTNMRVIVDLQFRPLMGLVRILNRQVVQAKRLLNVREQLLARLVKPHPQKTIGIAPGVAQIGDRHIRHAHAVAIRGGVDHAAAWPWRGLFRTAVVHKRGLSQNRKAMHSLQPKPLRTLRPESPAQRAGPKEPRSKSAETKVQAFVEQPHTACLALVVPGLVRDSAPRKQTTASFPAGRSNAAARY